MARVACFTSFTYAYLSRARVLAETVRRVHPDWVLWALLTDEAPPGRVGDGLAGFDHVMVATDLALPRVKSWLFKHDVVEACTAVKGAMLCHLLAQGVPKVVYLDPDIAVFAPLDNILSHLDAASIVLTPHQTTPNNKKLEIADNERTSLKFGTYNLGFLAVRNDGPGRAFATWWADRLYEACYDAPEQGLFTDQKYCDLVPGLFAGVHVERDPGYNVASWNINQRPIAVNRRGELTAAGRLLRFYHFTKIGGVGDRMTERYAGDCVPVYELIAWYKRALRQAEWPALDGHKWAYGQFSDGIAIPKPARLLWRARDDLQSRFPDPFAAAGGWPTWLRRERPDILPIEERADSG